MSTITTYTGVGANLAEPETIDFRIEDIAHALAHMCRFSGHTREFYSVAQHCVEGSYLIAKPYCLDFLMHDAHEAYVADVAAPLKKLLPDYRALEHRVESALRAWVGLVSFATTAVRTVDLWMLEIEQRNLMKPPYAQSGVPRQYADRTIAPWSPEVAKAEFLRHFDQYYEERYHVVPIRG